MIDGKDSMNLYDQNFFNENYFAETASQQMRLYTSFGQSFSPRQL